MRKIYFTLTMWILILVATASALDGGGTETDPYLITSCSELFSIDTYNNTAYYVLNNDIDCSGESNMQPIDAFAGHVDGQGHIVENIHIVNNTGITSDYYGIFSELSNVERVSNAELEYISFRNILLEKLDTGTVISQGCLAGVAFDNVNIHNLTVENCTSLDILTYGGGLLGRSEGKNVTINEVGVYNLTLDCAWNCGGILGDLSVSNGWMNYIHKTKVVDAFITSTGGRRGGICGGGSGSQLILNRSYVKNLVFNNTPDEGGLFGRQIALGSELFFYESYAVISYLTNPPDAQHGGLGGEMENFTVNKFYWDTETSNVTVMCGSGSADPSCDNSYGKTTSEMKHNLTYIGWDFDSFWSIDEGVSYPYFEVKYSIPNTPPLPGNITNPINNTYHHGVINISWENFTDAENNIVNYVVKLYNSSSFVKDIATVTVNDTLYDSLSEPDGLYKVVVVAVDAYSATANASAYFTVDNTPPEANITTSINKSYVAGTCADEISVLSSVSINESGFVNDGTLSDFKFRRSLFTSFVGWVNITCTDAQDNVGSDAAYVIIDKNYPECTGVSDRGFYSDQLINITVNCSDDVNLTYFRVTCADINLSYETTSINTSIVYNMLENPVNDSFVCQYEVRDLLRTLYYEQDVTIYYIGDGLNVGRCPDSESRAIILGMLILMALSLVYLGFKFSVGFITFFGGMLLMVASWTIAGCDVAAYMVMLIASIAIITFSMFVLPFQGR